MRNTALFVALLLLTACGGTSGQGPAPTSPTPPPPPAPTAPEVPAGVSAVVASMFQQLPTYIQSTLAGNQSNLPRNPQNAVQINAKISLLQRPTLAAEISAGRFFVDTTATSTDGRQITIGALYPEERYRVEAQAAVQAMQAALPILETFIDTPFPASSLRLWYGFTVGNSGGGGVLDMEDRTSYEGRTPATRLPYNAILVHEIGHSYIGNEILNQFLELYGYNRWLGAGTSLSSWTFTRNYTGPSDSNIDSALVLDVYQLIGHDAMARAYKAAHALRPPYGQPLSAAVIQVFVDQAPEPSKPQVAAKLGRVTF